MVGQIALSLLMLVAAGLFVRTLSNLQSVDLGFNRDNVLLFELDARKSGHRDPEISSFYGDLRKRFSAIPGVRHASLAESSLVTAGTGLDITLGGKPPDPATRLLAVGPAFFATMQVPILAGREIEEQDRPGSKAVAVTNERFAKVNFGGRNPLGQHLTLWDVKRPARDMEIVGVSRDAVYGGLKEEIPPVVYIPYDQGLAMGPAAVRVDGQADVDARAGSARPRRQQRRIGRIGAEIIREDRCLGKPDLGQSHDNPKA